MAKRNVRKPRKVPESSSASSGTAMTRRPSGINYSTAAETIEQAAKLLRRRANLDVSIVAKPGQFLVSFPGTDATVEIIHPFKNWTPKLLKNYTMHFYTMKDLYLILREIFSKMGVSEDDIDGVVFVAVVNIMKKQFEHDGKYIIKAKAIVDQVLEAQRHF